MGFIHSRKRMKILDDLYTFPIVMVDGENEERKERESSILGNTDSEPEYDIVYGEASYPYYDFIGIEDRWLPTQRSLSRALKSKFDACMVRFSNVGQLLVPMNKEKFMSEIQQFSMEREKTLYIAPKQEQPVIINLEKLIESIVNKNEKEQ